MFIQISSIDIPILHGCFGRTKTNGTYTTQHNNICNNLTFKSFPSPFPFSCTRVSFVRVPELRCAFTAFSATYPPTHILFHVILKIIIYAPLPHHDILPLSPEAHTHHAKLSIIHFQAQTSHSCINAPLHTYARRLGSAAAAAAYKLKRAGERKYYTSSLNHTSHIKSLQRTWCVVHNKQPAIRARRSI